MRRRKHIPLSRDMQMATRLACNNTAQAAFSAAHIAHGSIIINNIMCHVHHSHVLVVQPQLCVALNKGDTTLCTCITYVESTHIRLISACQCFNMVMAFSLDYNFLVPTKCEMFKRQSLHCSAQQLSFFFFGAS